ncbi:hypothetical protein FOA52_002349 [Chlamydomonas sp. UWO 241]|nr:hypothetical protein FOA52_002349 [Chlamydomonas sp. UWO 241]
MTSEVLALFAELSPCRARLTVSHFNWRLVWSGLLLESCVLPAAMAYTFAAPHIVWGGVTYHKSRGRVERVGRPPHEE